MVRHERHLETTLVRGEKAAERQVEESAVARLRGHLRRPLPLLHHLVLRTQSHASCAAPGFFALVGFYPFCLLLLWLFGDIAFAVARLLAPFVSGRPPGQDVRPEGACGRET